MAPPGRLGSVFAALGILLALTGLIARGYHREKRELAQRQFQMARLLAQQSRHDEAIEAYRAALSLSRQNPEYRLALTRELVETGRTAEAERHLLELLAHDPVNGLVNLMLARIQSARGRPADAATHYRRAVYGSWPEDQASNRLEARFELAALLLQGGATRQVQAQLLQLGDEIPDDPQLKKRVARLFLAAKEPREARNLYREVLRKQSLDAEAYAGLGAAEFAMGEYTSARNSLRTALRWNAHDSETRALLDLVEAVLVLDPTLRRIGAAERLKRSRTLVERARAELVRCLGSYRQPVPSFATTALGVAGKSLEKRSPGALEANLSAAEQLNAARMALCGTMEGDKALMLVLNKMAE